MIARQLIRIDEYIKDLERLKYDFDEEAKYGLIDEEFFKQNPYSSMLEEAFIKQKEGYDFVFYNNAYGIQDVDFIKPVADYIDKKYSIKDITGEKVLFSKEFEHEIEFLAEYFPNKAESKFLLLPVYDYLELLLSRQEKNNFEAGLKEKISKTDEQISKNCLFVLYKPEDDQCFFLQCDKVEDVFREMRENLKVKSFLNIGSMIYMVTEKQMNELTEQLIKGDITKFLEDYNFFVPLNDHYHDNFSLMKWVDNYKIRVIVHEEFAEVFYADMIEKEVYRIQIDEKLDIQKILSEPLKIQERKMVEKMMETQGTFPVL